MGTKVKTTIPPPTAQEQELLGLNVELAKKQLDAFDDIAPFQRQLLEQSTKELARQGEEFDILNELIGPEERAAATAEEFQRIQRLGPVQDELLELQLEQLRRGGAATPEQEQRIKESTDAAIEAGTLDIDASTSRGLELIKDQLANSRGLRLTDSPIGDEAQLLAREGEIQKGSLIKNLRASEAAARLNFPLAADQVLSSINQNQQNLLNAATNFQAQLRQAAFQNRQSLTGQTTQQGLGLTSVSGLGLGALNSLTQARIAQTTTKKGLGLSDLTSAASGIGGLAGGLGLAAMAF